MKQMALATFKMFEVHGRATRKAAFLARIEMLVPWTAFCALIEPHCPKVGNGCPPPYKGKCQAITFDNCKEFAEHESIAAGLQAAVHFAHPYHS